MSMDHGVSNVLVLEPRSLQRGSARWPSLRCQVRNHLFLVFAEQCKPRPAFEIVDFPSRLFPTNIELRIEHPDFSTFTDPESTNQLLSKDHRVLLLVSAIGGVVGPLRSLARRPSDYHPLTDCHRSLSRFGCKWAARGSAEFRCYAQ